MNSAAQHWTRKDLLGLRELLAPRKLRSSSIRRTLSSRSGRARFKKVPALRGKTLVNLFVEPSTRTRTSFELAAKRLSADVINISAAASSLAKGETLKDTARISRPFVPTSLCCGIARPARRNFSPSDSRPA